MCGLICKAHQTILPQFSLMAGGANEFALVSGGINEFVVLLSTTGDFFCIPKLVSRADKLLCAGGPTGI